MSLTLYANDNEFTGALKAIARYAQVFVQVETGFSATDVQAVSPGGQVPALATPEGGLFQTNAIARYIARNSNAAPLYGESEIESALIDGWLDWTREKVEMPARVLYPEQVLLATDYYVMKETLENVLEDLKVLNDHIVKNTWLVGRHMSIADIIAAFTIAPLFMSIFGKNHIKPFNTLLRWLRTVLEQPGVAAYFNGPFTLCKKSPVPANPPKRAEGESAPVDDVAPDASYLGQIESSFDLNDFKTRYANAEKVRPEITNWFWENYDPENNCLYIFNYKFFEECTVGFKTNNLFGGFLQRSDAIKAFSRNTCASMCVLEKDERFHIWGVWLFRGDELPRPWTDNIDDVNYYNWTPVDINNEEHKTLVNDFWAWESENNFGGRGTFTAGKTYGL